MTEMQGRPDRICVSAHVLLWEATLKHCRAQVHSGSNRTIHWKEDKESSVIPSEDVQSQQFLMISNYQFPWKGI